MVMPRLKKKFDIKLNMHNSTNVACDHVSEIDSKNLDQCPLSTALVAIIFFFANDGIIPN